ncbi:hypothetical protein LTR50_007487 [Elasticomyces elasticus]|nr:hypothetical protein LTR50_007487 [Elasticomyces elasticus]
MSKLITFFGVTENYGGSVIKYILADATLSKEFKIRSIVRDTSKPAAQTLVKQGVKVVSESGKPEVEVMQGQNVADAAKDAVVSHIIFSSLLNVTETTSGRVSYVPHFDKKNKIEKEP